MTMVSASAGVGEGRGMRLKRWTRAWSGSR